MFSPEYIVDSTRSSLDIETFSNHLEYGKVDLQVSSLHNSGALFFFFPLCSLAGCPECPCTPPTPKPADACRDVAIGGKRRLASSHPIHRSAPTPASGGRGWGGRTLFIIPSAEMQNHFCDSFSIIMKGD